MPYPFTGCKMFCAGPNFLSQPKNLTAFNASSKTFVPAKKTILLNANHLFVLHKMFVTGTICKENFGLVQIFCARPKINLHIVAVTKILCQTKRRFAFSKIGFLCRHKSF